VKAIGADSGDILKQGVGAKVMCVDASHMPKGLARCSCSLDGDRPETWAIIAHHSQPECLRRRHVHVKLGAPFSLGRNRRCAGECLRKLVDDVGTGASWERGSAALQVKCRVS